jgi:uncharacterized protein YprB with RNaseH-like and TPR domain
MDLTEKLKYYTAGTKRPVKQNAGSARDLYQRLQAIPVDPNGPDVLKIDQKVEYTHFMHEGLPDLNKKLHLPLLSGNRVAGKINLPDILIFDLETTGLAGGAGTFPFLIGFGIFEKTGIRIIQYFLPEYGRESIAYLDVAQIFNRQKQLLSFNGKSYDYPLLKNRFILNRIENPFLDYDHIDLLHFARRLWKNRLTNCSLSMIEQEVFLFHRFGDIDGWMIPQAYFDFLRTGHVDEIEKIVRHNQQDILSLGRLLFYMHKLEQGTDDSSIPDSELQALFNLAVRKSDLKRADTILGQLDVRGITLPGGSLVEYSLLLKRKNAWDRALMIWEQLLASQKYILFALEELAKYHEHRVGDMIAARQFTQRGIKYLAVMSEIDYGTIHQESRLRFEHRLKRIEQKIRNVR